MADRILVVDDEQEVADLLELYLTRGRMPQNVWLIARLIWRFWT